jgi:hypothetical protein
MNTPHTMSTPRIVKVKISKDMKINRLQSRIKELEAEVKALTQEHAATWLKWMKQDIEDAVDEHANPSPDFELLG